MAFKMASCMTRSLYATNLYCNVLCLYWSPLPGHRSRCAGALLQAVHQLAGYRHAGRQNIAGQRFGDVQGLAVGPAERAVVQVMMVRTVGVHEMGRQHVGVEAPHTNAEMADDQAVVRVHFDAVRSCRAPGELDGD